MSSPYDPEGPLSREQVEGESSRAAVSLSRWLHGIALVNAGKAVTEKRYVGPRMSQKAIGFVLATVLFLVVGSLAFQGYAYAGQVRRDAAAARKADAQDKLNYLILSALDEEETSKDGKRGKDILAELRKLNK